MKPMLKIGVADRSGELIVNIRVRSRTKKQLNQIKELNNMTYDEVIDYLASKERGKMGVYAKIRETR